MRIEEDSSILKEGEHSAGRGLGSAIPMRVHHRHAAEGRDRVRSLAVDSEHAKRRRRRIRLLQRYVLNPPVKLLVWFGLVRGHVLVETTGRRSGHRRRNVVGMHVEGTTGWVVAEQGRHAGYVRNLVANPEVRVRIGRRWRPARAWVVQDDDPAARLESFGLRSHAAAVRRFGTDLTTVRFNFPPDQPADTTMKPGPGPPAA